MKRDDPANGIVMKRGNFWFNRTIKGQREWHNLETTDLFEAIQRKAELLRSPALIQSAESIPRAIQRYIKWKLSEGEFRQISATNAMSGLNRLAKFVGEGATLASIRTQALQSWYDSMRAEKTEATAARYLFSVQSMFKWAIEIERVRLDNPAKGVRIVESPREQRVRWVDRDLREKLIAEAPNDDLRFMLYAGFHAGLRLTEISEARVFWFDLAQGLLHLQATPMPRGAKWNPNEIVKDLFGVEVKPFRSKNGRDRTIPLTPSFHSFLRRYLKGREAREFVGEPRRTHGIGFYRWPIKPYFTRYMTSQNCRWITPHVMRHTFASLLVMKGVSLYKVANWLGDTLTIAEQHYAHLAPLDADIQHLE
jgi:site-specific recombinase XerD